MLKKETSVIRRYIIVGERRPSNYWWASVIFLGAFGFLLTGLFSNVGFSSFLEKSLSFIPLNSLGSPSFLQSQEIAFFPQGLIMCFYGVLGIFVSFYWWLLIFWDIGGGFNEFNKKDGIIRIFRWSYPGKNRKIDLSYNLTDVEAIRVQLKPNSVFGVDPQRNIYLQLKGKREIPLTGIGQPLTLKEIEKQASELANFLQVSLDGL